MPNPSLFRALRFCRARGLPVALASGLACIPACNGKPGDTAAAADDGLSPCDETGLQGVVIDEVGTLGPVAGARVSIAEDQPNPQPPIETQTDADGAFLLELPAGAYIVSAAGRNGCVTDAPTSVDVPVCGYATVDLRLVLCQGG